MKKIAVAVSILLFVLGLISYPGVSNSLNIATGMSAKNICSGHFISGYEPEQLSSEALEPISDAFKLVSVEVDNENKRVKTSAFGLFTRHAVYRERLG